MIAAILALTTYCLVVIALCLAILWHVRRGS